MGPSIHQASLANTPSILTAATALVSNVNRGAWQIQNQGTNPLLVLLGTGASGSVYHFVLKGSTVAADGTGGMFGQNSGTVYTGVISVSGTSPSYTVLEVGV